MTKKISYILLVAILCFCSFQTNPICDDCYNNYYSTLYDLIDERNYSEIMCVINKNTCIINAAEDSLLLVQCQTDYNNCIYDAEDLYYYSVDHAATMYAQCRSTFGCP